MTANDMNPKWIMHNATYDFIAQSEQQERKNSKHDANAITQVVKFCKDVGYDAIPESTVDRKPKLVRKQPLCLNKRKRAMMEMTIISSADEDDDDK